MLSAASTSTRRLLSALTIGTIAAALCASCAKHAVIKDNAIDRRVLDDVVNATAEVRRLPAPPPLKAEVSNQEHLQSFLEKLWELEQTRARNEDHLFRRLGLLAGPPKRAGAPKASSLIGGYYDPRSETLFVVEDYALWVRAQYFFLTALTGVDWAYDTVLSHEIVHALQDQQVDLDRLLVDLETVDFDRALARRAVIESDANITSLFYGNAISPRGVVRRRISFTYARLNDWFGRLFLSFDRPAARFGAKRALGNYTLGLSYLERLLDRGGYDGVNHTFDTDQWPQSTEQLLAPEKYLDADTFDPPLNLPPLDLAAFIGEDAAQAADVEHQTSNTVGAWQLQLFLEEMLGWSFTPTSLSSKWGGDRYEIFNTGGHQLFVWRLVFDDEDAAALFASTWTTLVADRYPGRVGSPVDNGPATCMSIAAGDTGVYASASESLCVRQEGVRVLVVEGAEGKSAAVIADRVWPAFAKSSVASFVDTLDRPLSPVAIATDNWERPLPRSAQSLFLPERTLHLRLGVRARFIPGSQDGGFDIAPDFAAAWTARPGLMLSLPFAATVQLPFGRGSGPLDDSKRWLTPTLTAGFLRGVIAEPSVAAALVFEIDPGFAIATHAQVSGRQLFTGDRQAEVRGGAGVIFAIGDRIRLAPAIALTSRMPLDFQHANGLPFPTLEFGASHLRGLTRQPLVEIQVLDAIGAYLDVAFAVDILQPKLREHLYAAGAFVHF